MEIFFFAHRRTVYTSKWKILRNCKTKDMFLLVTSNKDPITLELKKENAIKQTFCCISKKLL